MRREVPIVAADFVVMEQGTGLVHIAPGHGEEDYELGRKLGLRVYSPVDDDGRFLPEVEHFGGLTVWEANPKIIEHLRLGGHLLPSRTITHTYPHCWRCKNPTLIRATEQWFIAMEKNNLRQRGLEEIRKVKWIPPWGEERISNMILTRPDWCISRQRGGGCAHRRLLRRGVPVRPGRAGAHGAGGGAHGAGGGGRLVSEERRGAAPARHPVSPLRRHPVHQRGRHPGCVVRLRRESRGRAGDPTRSALAGRNVPRGERSAPGLVP